MRKTSAEYQAPKTTGCWVAVAFTGRGSGVSSISRSIPASRGGWLRLQSALWKFRPICHRPWDRVVGIKDRTGAPVRG